jgi:hypothetical protein
MSQPDRIEGVEAAACTLIDQRLNIGDRRIWRGLISI